MDTPNRYYINTCTVCNDIHICECISEDSDYGFFCEIDDDLVNVPVKHPTGFSARSIMKKYIHKNGIIYKERRTKRPIYEEDYTDKPIKYAIHPDYDPNEKTTFVQMINELPTISVRQLSAGFIYAAILYIILF
jgi:hypothetical protein